MQPWFKGFNGSITKTGEKTYLCKGSYKVLDAKTIEITELPVGRWTEDYKEILNKLVIERGSKDSKGIIVDYENQSTDHSVYFKVYLKPGYLSTAQWSDGDIDKIEKDFKLTTTKQTSLTNIHLYNEDNTITRYHDIETIVRDYSKVRLELYEKRKEYQLQELEKQIHLLTAKSRFILDVVEERIAIYRQTKDKIKEQLVSKEYPFINESYDYLLKLPIYSLTKEEIDKLLQEKGDLESQYSELSNKTTKDIWMSELSSFEKEYSKFLKK
jgi:DNA topoisomerase-2